MKKRVFYWISGSNVREPVVSNVVLETGVMVNILKAKMEPREGFLILELTGDEEQIEKSIEILKKFGEAEDIPKIIQKDDEKCIDCGACVVHCPVGALSVDEEFKILLDEDECIGCKNCAKICPVNAIKIFEI
ncbi:4Fe-4S binding protein [Methanococcus maripaludis]|uniref:Ferredoxin n=4 Tax=Methanococcus maripaludis TaxID=39152 RepID=Q6LXJ2_METMP|nr:4Fe-4S binding protein [Methanococcus maripaludis]MDK2928570.1 L-aspartate semialdehyde sulfurtransferase ferredoxin [Methanococcus sp.]AEK20378.1 ferredoxin [Methanococcus maripaludis X1]MBA2847257.1 ferredoxin [Methanococcus maripaludis]MBA2850238.1 ferredoxin [Methanococcus maripaludis]MBB6067108.1 ferredoxin [Methanococcus maripaludis]